MWRSYASSLLLIVLFANVGCGSAPTLHSSERYPQRLSEWGLFERGIEPNTHSVIYDLNTPLFSDHAKKQRTLYIPKGQQITFSPQGDLVFPVGTIISKSFYYHADDRGHIRADNDGSLKVLETRLLVKQAEGWDALPYVWRGDDAWLAISGELLTLSGSYGELNYLVPSKNQCASCHATNHTTGTIEPIGLKIRHINRNQPATSVNQLTLLKQRDWLNQSIDPDTAPRAADAYNESQDLNHRARSYLDVNCGHCHNPQGAADTSALFLDYDEHTLADLGVCKPPIAAGRGSGGLNYSIVPGDAKQSILPFRMASTDPAVMMPELGRSLADLEGVALIEQWIDTMSGECR